MEPLWEYRWLYRDSYYGPVDTCFWMTDWEAERWHAHGKEGTMRIDETRRDRNLQQTQAEIPSHQFGTGRGPDNEQPLPEFVPPAIGMMRRWWVCPDIAENEDIRRLVLEVIALRRKLRDAGLGDDNGCKWPVITVRDKRQPKPRARKARRQ